MIDLTKNVNVSHYCNEVMILNNMFTRRQCLSGYFNFEYSHQYILISYSCPIYSIYSTIRKVYTNETSFGLNSFEVFC